MRTNEIYGKVAITVNGLSIIFFICVIFNLNIHSFSKKKFFVLKFQFIEVINSIYLILVQYVPALLLMYYNTETCKATHNITQYHETCNCSIKWFKKIALKVEMTYQGKTEGHIIMPKTFNSKTF